MRGRLAAVGRTLLGLVLGLVVACASGPPGPPAPGKAVAWGYLQLVPTRGGSSSAAGGADGDRRLRDVQFVDSPRQGFAVVYVVGGQAGPVRAHARRRNTGRDVALTIERGAPGVRLTPRHLALRQGDRVVVTNGTDGDHVLAAPSVELVKKIAPGASVVLGIPRAGEHAVHLLSGAGVASTLFVAPGPFAQVSASGRWVLDDLEPGSVVLRSWHPRLPPSTRRIALEGGEVVRQDLDVVVGRHRSETRDQALSSVAH